MKLNYLISAILISAIAVDVSAQERGKDKGGPTHKWRVQQLHKDDNEGVAVGDIDGDGKLDVTAGEFWYQAPDFKQRPLRKIAAFGADYMQNNSEHLYDMDGDGDLDVLAGAFTLPIVNWYEQPESEPFSRRWKYHHDFDLPHASCRILVVDLNKDGRNDIVWADGHSYGLYWHEQLEPQSDGTTTWRQHLIDKKFSQGHALAWDDVDNGGQPELITGKRFYGHSGRDAGAHDDITMQFYDWSPETGTWTKRLISRAPAGKGPGIGLQIRVHDLDGNGWKDIIVPGKSGTHIIWNDGK